MRSCARGKKLQVALKVDPTFCQLGANKELIYSNRNAFSQCYVSINNIMITRTIPIRLIINQLI